MVHEIIQHFSLVAEVAVMVLEIRQDFSCLAVIDVAVPENSKHFLFMLKNSNTDVCPLNTPNAAA